MLAARCVTTYCASTCADSPGPSNVPLPMAASTASLPAYQPPVAELGSPSSTPSARPARSRGGCTPALVLVLVLAALGVDCSGDGSPTKPTSSVLVVSLSFASVQPSQVVRRVTGALPLSNQYATILTSLRPFVLVCSAST